MSSPTKELSKANAMVLSWVEVRSLDSLRMVNWLEFVKMSATPVALKLVFSQTLGDVPAVQNFEVGWA